MSRAFLVVLDSLGIGGAPDAGTFDDEGANTLGHIAQSVPLSLPNLAALGLGHALTLASGMKAPTLTVPPKGLWGAATEISPGKDTPSGHWELAGLPVPWDWHFYPRTEPCFPPELVARVCEIAQTDGILGNCHASGTEIIARLGVQHMRSGQPICYTSSDSVFQIAAHEESFGLDRLLRLCETLAPELHAQKVGRVIARPFVGTGPEDFERTTHRRDYAVMPPKPVLCDWAHEAGRKTYGIGKIGDIFSMRGISDSRKGDDAALMGHLSDVVDEAPSGSLTFANFVEFDSKYGHRRDVAGYAAHLEWFDAAIGAILAKLWPGDLMIFTADHGNDPTWRGTDHTRERVPVLGAGLGPPREIGHIGFVDVAASIAYHLGIPNHGPGKSFL